MTHFGLVSQLVRDPGECGPGVAHHRGLTQRHRARVPEPAVICETSRSFTIFTKASKKNPILFFLLILPWQILVWIRIRIRIQHQAGPGSGSGFSKTPGSGSGLSEYGSKSLLAMTNCLLLSLSLYRFDSSHLITTDFLLLQYMKPIFFVSGKSAAYKVQLKENEFYSILLLVTPTPNAGFRKFQKGSIF